MRISIVALLAVASCTSPYPDATPDVRPYVVPTLPVCFISADAPRPTRMAFTAKDGMCDGLHDSGLFQFRYEHADGPADTGLSLDIPRGAAPALSLDAGEAGLLYQDYNSGAVCSNWSGAVTWTDLPKWSVKIDALCTDDWSIAVRGTWRVY